MILTVLLLGIAVGLILIPSLSRLAGCASRDAAAPSRSEAIARTVHRRGDLKVLELETRLDAFRLGYELRREFDRIDDTDHPDRQ